MIGYQYVIMWTLKKTDRNINNNNYDSSSNKDNNPFYCKLKAWNWGEEQSLVDYTNPSAQGALILLTLQKADLGGSFTQDIKLWECH